MSVFPIEPPLYLLCRRFSDLSVSAFHKTSLLFSESEALRFLDMESGIERDMIFIDFLDNIEIIMLCSMVAHSPPPVHTGNATTR